MGDQVIQALDANKDMKHGSVMTMLCQLGLRKVLLARHGSNAPPTTDNGSTTIDGIWAMQLIEIKAGGYLACGDTIPKMNDQALCIDINLQTLYRGTMPPIVRAKARQVKLSCRTQEL
jgi:hypothetical protein